MIPIEKEKKTLFHGSIKILLRTHISLGRRFQRNHLSSILVPAYPVNFDLGNKMPAGAALPILLSLPRMVYGFEKADSGFALHVFALQSDFQGHVDSG